MTDDPGELIIAVHRLNALIREASRGQLTPEELRALMALADDLQELLEPPCR